MTKQGYKWDSGAGTVETINANTVSARDDMITQLAAFRQVRAFDDATRTKLALGAPGFFIAQGQFPDLASLDQHLDDEIERLANILDYEVYTTTPFTINGVADLGYFLPEAIESFTDDNGSDVVANAIDAVNGGDPDPNDPEVSTFWQSEISGVREITFRLRDYNKRLEGIRLRVNASDARASLQDVTIRASQSLAMIDDPGNLMTTGGPVAFNNAGASNVDFLFPGGPKFNARYIKLEMSQSAHSNADELRIRSIQAIVGVINFEK